MIRREKPDISRTAINELQNRPRYDIDRRRYGNTLSDDMFALKNLERENQHTPESYEYLERQIEEPTTTWEPASGWGEIPSLKNENLVSREKFLGDEGIPIETRRDWSLLDDIMEFPENYTQEQVKWAEDLRNKNEALNRVNDLKTESLREDMAAQRGGERDYQEQSVRRDAEYDPYLEAVVNYARLSPQTLGMLTKMGVNRPEMDPGIENGSETLNNLIALYRYGIENGLMK